MLRAAPEFKGDQTGPHGLVGKPIYDDESAGLSILLIGVEGDRISVDTLHHAMSFRLSVVAADAAGC